MIQLVTGNVVSANAYYCFKCALQKGTGKWTAICALDYGVPLSLISKYLLLSINK